MLLFDVCGYLWKQGGLGCVQCVCVVVGVEGGVDFAYSPSSLLFSRDREHVRGGSGRELSAVYSELLIPVRLH